MYDKLYSPQTVVTIYEYTIENDLTKKREKRKKKVTHNTQINGMYLSKTGHVGCVTIVSTY